MRDVCFTASGIVALIAINYYIGEYWRGFMKFKAAIFDLDGTLIDSTWVWYAMMQEFCEEYGIRDELSCLKDTVHMPPTEFVSFIKEKYKLKQSVEEIKNKIGKTAYKFYSTRVNLKKGVRNLLNLMKENLIEMAIATSCFVELTEVVLKKCGVYDMFSCFLYSEKLNTNKRSADLYIAAANQLGFRHEECAVFEDISIPLNAVRSCNMGYFGVADERREQEVKDELKLKADYYIEDYDEFIENGIFNKFFNLKGEII